ncbi:MAG: glycosyltransferase family 4 protein [Phycisphaerales bacterium]|nr:glycosyltransferase family 4 protein [Phycisphaerales bacterium]
MADDFMQPVESLDALLVIDEDAFARMGTAIRHLCVGFIEEPIRAKVLSRTARLAPVLGDAIGPAPVTTVSRRCWPWPIRPAAEILGRLGGDPPDVVHCFSASLARQAASWAAEWGSLLLVHLSDLVDIHRFRHVRRSERVAAIASTATLAEAFLKQYPKMKDRLCQVPFGITAGSEPACLAQPQRVPSVIITAPLTRDCGLDVVLRALHRIVHEGQETQLFIISGGPAEKQFRRLADRLDIRSHVTFVGPLQDWVKLGEAMRAADFYLLPASRRRFTISTLLAMANGLTIIAPQGTIGDYLIDGQTATLFDPDEPEDMTAKWQELLIDRGRARRMAFGALDYVRAHHKASMMVARTAAFYRQICC